MSKCIIHVGMHKTGSTSIQQSLDGFSDDTFYYASLGNSPNHSLPIYSLFSQSPEKHHLHRKSDRNRNELKKYIGAMRIDLEHSMANSDGRTMILSGEDIATLPGEALTEMRNCISQYFSKIRIEAYVRAPAAYINSAFQQRVKRGLGSMDAENLYCSYKNRFAKFDKVFGEENVHFRKFIPKEFPNKCVVTDFCLHLGINLAKERIYTVNESLSLQAVRLLYTYNKFCSDFNAEPMFGSQAIRFVNHLKIAGETKFRFSSEILNPILEVNRDDIAWIEQRMGDTLKEILPNHQPGDVRDESDLLHIDNEVLTSLVKLTGASGAKNLTGKKPEQVAQLLHALRQKIGLNSKPSNNIRKSASNAPILNRARVGRTEPKIIAGWAIGSQMDRPVEVVLIVNGREVMHATADHMRKGMRDKGLHPTGRCGFAFKFGDKDQLSVSDEIIVRFPANEIPDFEVSLGLSRSSSVSRKLEVPKAPKKILDRLNRSQNKSKEIILHVGHGKTGSSYIQSALAVSIDRLKSLGIAYPNHASFSRASAGHISSGNLKSTDDQVLNNLVRAIFQSKNDKVLLSYEGLFNNILSNEEAFATTLKGFKVRIILFIRDPLEHMLSAYNQSIKRGRNTHSLEKFATRYNMPSRVGRFIKFCKDQNYDLNVINYSKNKAILLQVFERAINIPLSSLNIPPIATINRSLSISELEVQRLFNLHYTGQSFKFISDTLCNELPDMRSEQILLSGKATSAFISRMSKDIDLINEVIDAQHHYSLPPDTPIRNEMADNKFVFTGEQLEILVASICKKLNAPAPRKKKGLTTKKPRKKFSMFKPRKKL
ncbi:MAG: hypothetical protein ACPHYF_06820 [Akkermansiaceae bacterium]